VLPVLPVLAGQLELRADADVLGALVLADVLEAPAPAAAEAG